MNAAPAAPDPDPQLHAGDPGAARAAVSAEPAAIEPAQPAASGGLLALVEAVDHHGALLARAGVTHWPLRVGRALDCDLVLHEPHVAPLHLEIGPDGRDSVQVRLAGSHNGATLEREAFAPGQEFVWHTGQNLWLGRIRLGLRMAGTPLAPELPFAQSGWSEAGQSGAVLLALLAMSLFLSWLDVSEPDRFAQSVPLLLVGLLALVAIWSAGWALVSRLFGAAPQFFRHLRIACSTLVLAQLGSGLLNLLAFMFSWEALSRYENHVLALWLAGGLWAHLRTVAPQRDRAMGLAVAGLAVLGLSTALGSQWLLNKRLSSQLYLAALFPPQLRVAAAQPAAQFVEELTALRARLDKRIKDGPADGATDEAGDEE